jgi:hypothetical protein
VEDFKRLIKRSYMASYTKDDDGALGKEELLRLLVLGNGYEMVWCVEECAQGLQPFAGYDDALAYFRLVPDSLLQTERLRSVTMAAGDALAVALGPVEELLRPSGMNAPSWRELYLLDERVKALPVGGMEALLRSEKLQLKSENCTFSLARWWILAQEGTSDEWQPLFTRLLKSLRYARMSSVFLASITRDPLIINSGLLPSIMTNAIWRRDTFSHGASVVYPLRSVLSLMPASRVPDVDRHFYTCTLKGYLIKEAVEALGASKRSIAAPLGMLHGFPLGIALFVSEDGECRFAIHSPLLKRDRNLTAPGQATPAWDDDGLRGFGYMIPRGTVGVLPLQKNKAGGVFVASYHPILTCSHDALVYDEEGKLWVEIEIKVFQHQGC